ncbi:hypothetical protein V5O48_014847 [Marasmius crinis-equi]|uniref:DUF6697 domain-containing protein n=1 Tax=Marasmius crinis-equi TaxID=585013 RepID=A0ABR3EW77_9AGAR
MSRNTEINSAYGSGLPAHGHEGSVEELFRIPLCSVVDMAFEIEKERSKATEALKARDVAVGRLGEAYKSLRQRTALLNRLQKENKLPESFVDGEEKLLLTYQEPEVDKLKQEVVSLETTVNTLKNELKTMKENSNKSEPRLSREDNGIKNGIAQDYFNSKNHLATPVNPFIYHRLTPPALSRNSSQNSVTSSIGSNTSGTTVVQPEDTNLGFAMMRASPSAEAEDIIKARNELLESVPLPEDTPDDVLRPITLPDLHSTLHEFLSNAPAREEHGYFLTPVFRCDTNPRVATAHRWNAVDVLGTMITPTDCFYNKEGIWYYAGVYQAFRLDDLTAKEWEALSNEASSATQSIIKDTLAARKNISPQNVYEVAQLYAAGALRVACVGLQCVGFNKPMYRALLEYVNSANQSNKPRPTHGRGSSRDLVDTMANLQIASHTPE